MGKARQTVFNIMGRHPCCFRDDEPLQDLIEDLAKAISGVAQAGPDLRAAAERVCWFDWSDNDMDAVAAVEALRKVMALSLPSTPRTTEAPERCPVCQRTDEDFATGDWYCSNPWHVDNHLRRKSRVTSTDRSTP